MVIILFVNGRQELNFNCKTDHLVKEKLCIGNLSDQWTTSESEKTGLYGSIYDFVVDYEQIVGVKTIYDMHRYLMTKRNIKPIYDTYYIKMWLIGLTISLFNIIKTRALERVSVVNQKCMPRPKILDVNEGVGEALFYPYNVLVNKCSGSCNTFDNPMAKLCVPNVIKRVNMQVYNFLMMLNETRNVLWHESCKCVCKLNSSICNNKQIWNGDTCRCDCNEDFTGIINCTKGCTWNPSTCECQSDRWCKPGEYLDHKCTGIINETMINNKDNNTTKFNAIKYFFIELFLLTLVICFCVFAYFKWFKGKYTNNNKIYTYNYKNEY